MSSEDRVVFHYLIIKLLTNFLRSGNMTSNLRSLLHALTPDPDNHSNEIIDLTQSFESRTVNWPTGTIDLNEVTASPPTRRRRLNGPESQDNSDIVVINDSPAPARAPASTSTSACTSACASASATASACPYASASATASAPLSQPRKAMIKTRRLSITDKDNNQPRKETEAKFRDRSPTYFGNCPICFEPLGKNPLASTKCGHVFCVKCLEQAVKTSKKCPNCRTVLHGKTAYHPLYFSSKK